MSEVCEKENLIGLPNLRLDHYSTEPGNKEKAFRGLGDSLPQLLHSDKLPISVKPAHCEVTTSSWYSKHYDTSC